MMPPQAWKPPAALSTLCLFDGPVGEAIIFIAAATCHCYVCLHLRHSLPVSLLCALSLGVSLIRGFSRLCVESRLTRSEIDDACQLLLLLLHVVRRVYVAT